MAHADDRVLGDQRRAPRLERRHGRVEVRKLFRLPSALLTHLPVLAVSFSSARLASDLGQVSITNGRLCLSFALPCVRPCTHVGYRFHIGVAKEHPPLPDPSQLSELGIEFIRACLTIDPTFRPSAETLLDFPWIRNFTCVQAIIQVEYCLNAPQ